MLVDSGCAKDAAIRSRRGRRRTHCRWQAAWRRHGPAGLEPRSTRPQRRRYGMKAQSPGDSVRIDHMTVQRDGRALKEFRAVDPVSRVMMRRVFLRAPALNAKRFLDAAHRHAVPGAVGAGRWRIGVHGGL